MFLTFCGPRSSKPRVSARRAYAWVSAEIYTLAGSARLSSRAAMFTTLPDRSSSRTITSPTCTPIRNWRRRSSGVSWSAWVRSFWTSMAHRTASTALGTPRVHCRPLCWQYAHHFSVMSPSMIPRQVVRLLEGCDPHPGPSGVNSLPCSAAKIATSRRSTLCSCRSMGPLVQFQKEFCGGSGGLSSLSNAPPSLLQSLRLARMVVGGSTITFHRGAGLSRMFAEVVRKHPADHSGAWCQSDEGLPRSTRWQSVSRASPR